MVRKKVSQPSQAIVTLLTTIMLALPYMMSLTGCSAPQIPTDGHPAVFEGVSDITLSDEESRALAVNDIISEMSLSNKVSALFIARPEEFSEYGEPVTAMTPYARSVLEIYPVAGICWFQKNMEDEKQALALTTGFSQAVNEIAGFGCEFLDCIDEEGGTVRRVGGHDGFPSSANTGDTRLLADEDEAYSAGKSIGEYLSGIGIDVDFAPVGDVTDDPNDMIYLRSFGYPVQRAADMSVSEMRGLSNGGVIACPKHFPGIGEASGGDSHANAVSIPDTLGQIREGRLVPFKAMIDSGAQMVMVGHLDCPEVDPSRPASLSSIFIKDILRGELGFDGIVITDSLGMGALSGSGDDPAVLALEAGADLLLMPADLATSHAAVLDAVEGGRISEHRLDDALRRVLSFRITLSEGR